VWVDAVDLAGALEVIAAMVEAGEGGRVFTPNVDHVVLADHDRAFRQAYERASLTLADGAPVVWASWLLGRPLPAKVSGSDLVMPLVQLAAVRGWRVYLLGAEPDVAAEAARRLHDATGVEIAGVDSPRVALDDTAPDAAIIARVQRARPHLVLVAFGSPKQEVWADRVGAAMNPAVVIGVGASLDFVTGRQRRAPAFLSAVGLEWLFRLAREPRRLWRRYLLRDPAFLWIAARTLCAPFHTRARAVATRDGASTEPYPRSVAVQSRHPYPS